MATWEIVLDPDEVEEAIAEYARAKYGAGDDAEYEAVNDWPWVNIKMGEYPPTKTDR